VIAVVLGMLAVIVGALSPIQGLGLNRLNQFGSIFGISTTLSGLAAIIIGGFSIKCIERPRPNSDPEPSHSHNLSLLIKERERSSIDLRALQ
jgi:uncharacterized membrane protein YuzA (DUF378 family)